jgi:hypothetical protein
MRVEEALKLKKGDRVHCPEDRGNPGFLGKVVVGAWADEENTKSFIWVVIQTPTGHKEVWPSNRIERG